jgi:hypothetical protein
MGRRVKIHQVSAQQAYLDLHAYVRLAIQELTVRQVSESILIILDYKISKKYWVSYLFYLHFLNLII